MTDPRSAEEIIAAQRAGQGPPPGEPAGAGPAPKVAAAAALAAAALAVKNASAVAPSAAADAAQSAFSLVIAGVLRSFDAFTSERREFLRSYVLTILGAERAMTTTEIDALVAEELDRERQFAAASRRRVARDLPAAVVSGSAGRKAAVARVLERERRFAKQREAAVVERAIAHTDRARVREASPDGAYWQINPLLDNCERCRAMAGKVWPWSVLEVFRPPVHMHCACKLLSIDEAIRRGLIRPGDYASFDDLPRPVLEAPGVAYVVEVLDLLEVRFDEVYGRCPGHDGHDDRHELAETAVTYAPGPVVVPPRTLQLAPPRIERSGPPSPTGAQLAAAERVATMLRPNNRSGRVDVSPWFAYDPRARVPTRDGDVLLLPPAWWKRPRASREHQAVQHVQTLAEEARRGESQ